MTKLKLATTAAIAALALAGCDSSTKLENASLADVAKASSENNKLQAGQWDVTVAIREMSAPGMPPEMASAMKKSQTQTTCITPEQAANPNGIFANSGSGPCTFEKFEMGGGKVDGEMTCKGMPGTGDAKGVMSGTYSPTAYNMDVTSTAGLPGGAGEMKMVMNMTGKRTGECAAGAAGKAS